MIKKMNLVLGVVCLLTLTSVKAQVAATSTPIKGTPYTDEAYVDGVIYYADKNLAAPIRYNAFQDLIEYKQNGKALVLDANLTIQRVQLGNSSLVPQKYETKGKTKLGYFTLLDSGKVMLFAKKTIVYTAEQKGRALDGIGDLPAQYKPLPDAFYVKVGDGVLQEVTSIKSMVASFPDKQDELTQYARKEKISPKKEKELVQLIEYYNSL